MDCLSLEVASLLSPLAAGQTRVTAVVVSSSIAYLTQNNQMEVLELPLSLFGDSHPRKRLVSSLPSNGDISLKREIYVFFRGLDQIIAVNHDRE